MKRCFLTLFLVMIIAVQTSAKGLDADGDGKVTKEEFLSSFEKRFKAKGKEFNAKKVAAAFAKKDKNNDGVLTSEELPPNSM